MEQGQIYQHFKGGRYVIMLPDLSPIYVPTNDKKIFFVNGVKDIDETIIFSNVRIEKNMLKTTIHYYRDQFCFRVEKPTNVNSDKWVCYCSLQTAGFFLRTHNDFLEEVNKLSEYNYVGPRFKLIADINTTNG